jgi:surfeit locus 1 family protein
MPATSGSDRRARLWPLLAAVLGIAAAVALGNWQLGRAAQKREAQAKLEAQAAQPPIILSAAELEVADVDLRRVEARGTFDPRHTVLLDNRMHRGVPGYHVVTPLRIEGAGRHVLVNRGWVARTADRARLPGIVTPGGVVTVRGLAMVPRQRSLELSTQVMEGPIWQNLTIERYRAARPIDIHPFVIQQDSASEDGLVRDWAPPDFGIDKHYGYAFQWFALAATILAFYAITRYRGKRDRTA